MLEGSSFEPEKSLGNSRDLVAQFIKGMVHAAFRPIQKIEEYPIPDVASTIGVRIVDEWLKSGGKILSIGTPSDLSSNSSEDSK